MTEDAITIRGSPTVASSVKIVKLNNLRSLIVDVRSSEDAYGFVTQTDIVYTACSGNK